MTDNNKIQASSVDNNKIQDNIIEQWKKGELPEGWYFVILNNGKVDIAKCSNLFINCGRKLKRNFAIDNVAEVIEPICYEKWKAVNQNMDSVIQTNQALCQKLTQLKELLKECRNILNEQTFHRNTCLETDETLRNRIVKKAEILQKIDEALK